MTDKQLLLRAVTAIETIATALLSLSQSLSHGEKAKRQATVVKIGQAKFPGQDTRGESVPGFERVNQRKLRQEAIENFNQRVNDPLGEHAIAPGIHPQFDRQNVGSPKKAQAPATGRDSDRYTVRGQSRIAHTFQLRHSDGHSPHRAPSPRPGKKK